jgi:hypothetical protein
MPVGPRTPSLPRQERPLHRRLYRRHQQKHDCQKVEHQNHDRTAASRSVPDPAIKTATYRTGPISAAKRTFSLIAAACATSLHERLGGSRSALRTIVQLSLVSGNFHGPLGPSMVRSARSGCLDHLIVFSEPDLRLVLSAYATHCNRWRPAMRRGEVSSQQACRKIAAEPVLDGYATFTALLHDKFFCPTARGHQPRPRPVRAACSAIAAMEACRAGGTPPQRSRSWTAGNTPVCRARSADLWPCADTGRNGVRPRRDIPCTLRRRPYHRQN